MCETHAELSDCWEGRGVQEQGGGRERRMFLSYDKIIIFSLIFYFLPILVNEIASIE